MSQAKPRRNRGGTAAGPEAMYECAMTKNNVLAAIPLAALMLDRNDQVVAANVAAVELLGADPSGAAFAEFAPEGLASQRLRRSDGRAFEVALHAGPPASGDQARLVLLADTSHEHRVSCQLADAERIARIGIWEWNIIENRVTWSDEAFRLFGVDPSIEPSYALWLESIHPDDREWVNDFVSKALADRRDYDFRHRALHPDGSVIHVHCRGQVVLDEQGEPLRLVGVSRDVTEEVALASEREAVLSSAAEGICGIDPSGRVCFANPAAAELLNSSVAALDGTLFEQRVLECEEGPSAVADAIADGTAVRCERAVFRTDDGCELPVAFHLSKPAEGVAVLCFSDASERRHYETQLRFLADHDALTGLYNRRRFEEEVSAQVDYAARYGGSVAVLVIDLDHFKDINDTSGHGSGDELIKNTARLLRAQLRPGDVVARLGGDEFAMLMPAVDAERAAAAAEQLRATLEAQTLLVGGRRVHMTASIGVATAHGSDGADQHLLADADVAMYAAKEAGRNRVNVYHSAGGHKEQMEQRLTWIARIRQALERRQFVLFAQPIVPVRGESDGQCYELLIRLREADGSIVPPSAFLPVAERHGLIWDIDQWVVSRATELSKAVNGNGRGRVSFEINLSGLSLANPVLPELIASELQRTGADPDSLIFEVTETAAIDSLVEARSLADRVEQLGCQFALDDFGAGFGSLAYLKHLPSDYVKIDGEFIRGLSASPTDQLLVKAVVTMAHGMDKKVIAEFVEDADTLALLDELEVDLAQGYYLGRPAPLEQHFPELGAAGFG